MKKKKKEKKLFCKINSHLNDVNIKIQVERESFSFSSEKLVCGEVISFDTSIVSPFS